MAISLVTANGSQIYASYDAVLYDALITKKENNGDYIIYGVDITIDYNNPWALKVGTGALLICGRMILITSEERVLLPDVPPSEQQTKRYNLIVRLNPNKNTISDGVEFEIREASLPISKTNINLSENEVYESILLPFELSYKYFDYVLGNKMKTPLQVSDDKDESNCIASTNALKDAYNTILKQFQSIENKQNEKILELEDTLTEGVKEILKNKEEIANLKETVTSGLEDLNNNKADKHNASGGFEGGQGASAKTGGAVGIGAEVETGGAAGQKAMSYSGFAGGENSYCFGAKSVGGTLQNRDGGAAGYGATAGAGFSGGYNAKVSKITGEELDPFYIDAIQLGEGTNEEEKTLQVYDHKIVERDGRICVVALRSENGGFAGGMYADAAFGGAVGSGTVTGNGFAGGFEAKAATGDSSNGYTGIDAIQLGTGTNREAKTMQVYNYKLLDANGNIPTDRLRAALTELGLLG